MDWITIVYLVGFAAIIYFLIIRPEKKRKKTLQEMRDSLEVGNKIVTIGGLVGKVVEIKDDLVTFETGEDRVRIQILRSAVSEIVKAESK